MTMTRRNFVKTGIGGLAALTLAQKESSAQNSDVDQGIVVFAVEGSTLNVPYIDDYLRVGATVFQYSGNTMDFERFNQIDSFVAANPSKVILAKSVNDILAAKQAGKVAIVAGAQDMYPLDISWQEGIVRDNPLQNGANDWVDYPPQTQLSNYYDRGLRMANMSYNFSNFFGGGCLDPTTPLSRAGNYLVGQMQDIGILVDTSHSSDQTSLDIVKTATRPVVASHSNPSAIVDNPRNISDRVIEGIAKTGGLIGLNATNAFILWSREDALKSETGPFPPLATISQYVDMIDYVVRLVGIDYAGIGPDWTWGDPADHSPAPDPAKSNLYPPEMLYNEPNGEDFVKNFSGISDLPVFRAELVRHGYSPFDIAKILGGNWMRVFSQAWNS